MKQASEKIELQFNGDLRFPAYLLYFAPIFLGLFSLLLSLADYSVFNGFDESEPGTWMSLTLMFISLLIILPKTRTSNTEPIKRKIAIIMSFIIGIAMVDEKLQFHESIGYFVQDNFQNLPISVTTYTDDVLIIIGALLGGILLFYTFKYIGTNSVSRNYFIAVFTAALVHGTLDLISHKQFILNLLLPSLASGEISTYQEYIGYFEETFKLWTEWFFILFVLNLFYDQKGFLTWSIVIGIASIFAGFGLWNVELVSEGISFIVVEGKLKFIRNYHLFFIVSLIWVIWSSVVWGKFKHDTKKIIFASLFLINPFYLLLYNIEEWRFLIFSFFSFTEANSILLPIIIIVAAVAFYIYKKDHELLPIIVLTSGLMGFSFSNLFAQPLFLLKIGGIFFPVLLLLTMKQQNNKLFLIIGALFSIVFIKNPVWFIIIYGYLFLMFLEKFSFEGTPKFKRNLIIVSVLQAVILISLFSTSITNLLPVKYFPIRNKILFDVGHQILKTEKPNSKN